MQILSAYRRQILTHLIHFCKFWKSIVNFEAPWILLQRCQRIHDIDDENVGGKDDEVH